MQTTYSWERTAHSIVTNGAAGDSPWGLAVAADAPGARFLAGWNTTPATLLLRGRLLGTNDTGGEIALGGPDAHELSLAPLPGGGFVAAFSSFQDHRVFTRLYGADGRPVSAPLVVPSVSSSSLSEPDVAALSNGGAVTVYDHYFSGQESIRAQLRDAGGSAFEVVVNLGDAARAPNVAGLAGGGFAVAWIEMAGSGYYNVRLRRFDEQGNGLDGNLVDGALVTGSMYSDQVDIAALPDGGFVVAYTDRILQFGNGSDIAARIFNADGSPRAFVWVNSGVGATVMGDQRSPSVAVLPNGLVTVGWMSGGDTWVQAFDATGQLLGNNMLLFGDAYEYAITGLSGGRVSGIHSTAQSGGLELRTSAAELVRTVTGDAADDIMVSSADLREVFIGGVGTDTLTFGHDFNEYTVRHFGSKFVVTGPDGHDTLSGIERLQFADVLITPVEDGNGLFDPLYYLSRNADVFAAGVNPLEHFNTFGWREGRDPNPFFSVSQYLAANPDVAAAGTNPLDHYQATGWKEGRDPSAAFDTTLYLRDNPDVAAAGVDPLAHFLQAGLAEGRAAHEALGAGIQGGFDAQLYLMRNIDVATAGVDPLAHFNAFGRFEGRDPNGWFDTSGYLAHYGDVAAAGANPLAHYNAFGWKEGRDPSPQFDTLGYLAANPDVAAAGVNPLGHYLMFGIYEGRQAVNDGLWG